MVWANIRANTETWLKKHPVIIDYLPDHQKILIEEGIKISRCQILERKEEHVLVEFGDKKNSWWLITDHWDGFKKF
tara:strand:+ start:519 stop:746 length:228 start_codon:yes stop_codon:yes gene_type:complete